MAKQRIIPIVYKVDYTQVDKSTASVKKAEQATDKLNKEIKETESASSKSFGSIKNAIVASGIITVVTGLAKKILDIGIAAEQTSIAFNTFLGSAEKGKKLLQDLTKFAIVTPFTPDQVNKAAKSLLAFGVEASKIIPTLKMLGDVSSGTGKDLSEMAVIFGQIRSTGRLMGQDLLQLINAGFNPLQIISQKTGKSVGDLKKEMEKGLITFEMVEGAFKSATSEGGLFFDLMRKQSESVGGLLSTIEGNLEEIGKRLFENNQGGLKDAVRLVAELTSNVDGLSGAINTWIDTALALSPQYQLLKLINQEMKDAAESNRKFAEALLLQQSALLLTDQTLEERRKTMENIVLLEKELGRFDPGSTEDPLPWATEKKAADIEKVTKANEKARAEFMKMMGFTSGAEKFKENQKADDLEAQRQSDAIDREIEQDKRRADVLKANNADMEAEKTRIAEEEADKRIKIAQEEAENKRRAEEAAFEFGVDAIGALLIANTDSNEMEMEMLNEKYNREIELAGNNEKAKEQIQLRKEQEERRLRLKQVEDEKKQNTRRILIETVLNAVKALGLPPIPGANFIAAGKATAYGLLAAGIARRYAKGSEVGIDGPGTTKSDSIPAMLSKGETVMSYEQTTASRGILKAIKAKKLDDRLLEKLYKKAGSGGDGVAFSDERIVQTLKRLQPDDVIKKGSYLYDVKRRNADSVAYIRRKYIH